MGTKAREIIGMDVDQLVDLLKKAYADEWLAYYQYWVGAKVAVGPMREVLVAELTEHAADELRHADMLTMRILQLGGTPLLKPEDWNKMTNCGYEAPEDPYVKVLLEQNIKGEQCAIDVYNHLLALTKDKDPVTHNLVFEILRDEIEHEDDLQSLLEDFETMKRR